MNVAGADLVVERNRHLHHACRHRAGDASHLEEDAAGDVATTRLSFEGEHAVLQRDGAGDALGDIHRDGVDVFTIGRRGDVDRLNLGDILRPVRSVSHVPPVRISELQIRCKITISYNR